jgi:hypothetical protein
MQPNFNDLVCHYADQYDCECDCLGDNDERISLGLRRQRRGKAGISD